MNPNKRDDLSKFIVHLTRDYEKSSAEDNLINILNDKIIEARNYHCLFNYDIDKLKFSDILKKKFKTVCFTEIPLNQIQNIVVKIPGRQIKLKPFGLVFWRDNLLSKGANPAIYINGSGKLKKYLLNQFREKFNGINLLKEIRSIDSFYNELINYYSMINVIQDNHDFTWEREWRYTGDYEFNYKNIVAIIAEYPDIFLDKCSQKFTRKKMNFIERIPMISPTWNYDEILESFAISIWQNKK
jgi:hypothetical protein